MHWYKDRAEAATTAAALLDEGEMRRAASSLRRLVEAAGRYSKGLRVAEMNSISNNGRRGVSDALGGALWALDAALEAAAAGATGVNFHWGSGANVYSAVIRRTKDGKPPIVRPAFYAYALLQMALAGGGARVHPDAPERLVVESAAGGRAGALKVWPLQVPSTGGVRAVVINKDAAVPALVTVTFNRGDLGDGRLVRLAARGGGLGATGGVRLGGVAYADEGVATLGTPRVEAVPRAGGASGGGGGSSSRYEVYLPPASAALLTALPGGQQRGALSGR